MKKTVLLITLPVFAIFIFIAAQQPTQAPQPVVDDIELDWPEEVVTLLERACFDCHSAESGNMKGKGKLNFSKWDDYKLTKKIGKLDGIGETVKHKDMPPRKYLEKNPESALSDEEIKLIVEWADAEADKLMEE